MERVLNLLIWIFLKRILKIWNQKSHNCILLDHLKLFVLLSSDDPNSMYLVYIFRLDWDVFQYRFPFFLRILQNRIFLKTALKYRFVCCLSKWNVCPFPSIWSKEWFWPKSRTGFLRIGNFWRLRSSYRGCSRTYWHPIRITSWQNAWVAFHQISTQLRNFLHLQESSIFHHQK